MKNRITFRELREFLLEMGFREGVGPTEIVFRHLPADIYFVFRPYRPTDPVADYNLMEVKGMLDARGLMSAESFEDQFRKKPA